MKILQICSVPVSYPGGTEKVVLELSKELSKKHSVTILQTNLYEENKPLKRLSNIGKVKVITCKNDKFLGGFGYSKEFKKMLGKIWKNFDVIHVHGHGRFTSDFTIRKIGTKKPIVYTAHGFFHSSKAGKIKEFYNWIFKRRIKGVSFFTALTELEKKQYLKLGVPSKKIIILPNWINLKEFLLKKNEKILKNLKIPSGKKNILYVGRLHKSKGIQFVLQAIKELDVNFLIVGRDAGFKENLEKMIKHLGIEKKVRIFNDVNFEDIKNIYKTSDIFVLFSEWEGFGIVILEAMASKIPVIVSDKGALPYLVKNEETGMIAKYPNIKALKNKIEILLKDKKLRDKIIDKSSEFVKKFDEKIIIKKFEKLYENAIKK